MRISNRLFLGVVYLLFISSQIFSFNGQKIGCYEKIFKVVHDKNMQDPTKGDKDGEVKEVLLEDILKLDENFEIYEAFFAPNHDLQGILIGLMKKEKSSMKITIYSLRDAKIVNAILEALERGVKVEIIFDAKFESNQLEKKLAKFAEKGASVFVFQKPEYKPNKEVTGIMHNKYVLFENNIYGKKLVWTGSLNFSSSSHRLNQENVLINSNLYSFKSFTSNFDDMKHRDCYTYGICDGDYMDESDDAAFDDECDSEQPRKRDRDDNIAVEKKYNLRSRKRKREFLESDDENIEPKKKRTKVKHCVKEIAQLSVLETDERSCWRVK